MIEASVMSLPRGTDRVIRTLVLTPLSIHGCILSLFLFSSLISISFSLSPYLLHFSFFLSFQYLTFCIKHSLLSSLSYPLSLPFPSSFSFSFFFRFFFCPFFLFVYFPPFSRFIFYSVPLTRGSAAPNCTG